MNKIDSDITLEQQCVERIRAGDEDAFKELFLKYYPYLCALAAEFVGSIDLGDEIVQEVFLNIWDRRERWNPHGPLKPYLYRSVCNRGINFIKREKSRKKTMELYYEEMVTIGEFNTDDEHELKELTRVIWKIVNKLPKRQYLVFTMHKLHGLSYKEIAESLEISVKTVENQIGLALKYIRNEAGSKIYND